MAESGSMQHGMDAGNALTYHLRGCDVVADQSYMTWEWGRGNLRRYPFRDWVLSLHNYAASSFHHLLVFHLFLITKHSRHRKDVENNRISTPISIIQVQKSNVINVVGVPCGLLSDPTSLPPTMFTRGNYHPESGLGFPPCVSLHTYYIYM